MSQSEIILYQPDEAVKLEVRMEDETVWLTQAQMVKLFQRDQSVIARHINNIFKEEELDKESNMHFCIMLFLTNLYLYSLDVIISVGYRVKSKRGTQFRQWANKVLKDYLLKGYSINQRINQLESRIESKFANHDRQLEELTNKVDFFVRTSLPPIEGVFFDGQIFDAYKFATDLIKSANKSLLLIDNYVDESVLLMLSKRNKGVSAIIYTQKITDQLQLDLEKHNDQYPPINIKTYRNSHDRFLIVDDKEVYHIGASLKDLGKKMFAFSKLEIDSCLITDKL